MGFVSHFRLKADWRGEWQVREDCRIGYAGAGGMCEFQAVKLVDLVVVAHEYSGMWRVRVSGESQILNLYAAKGECRAILVWRSLVAKGVRVEWESLGTAAGSLGAEIVVLGFETDVEGTGEPEAEQYPRLRELGRRDLPLGERLKRAQQAAGDTPGYPLGEIDNFGRAC